MPSVWWIPLVAGVSGLYVGTLATSAVEQVPRRLPVSVGGVACESCGSPIGAIEWFPIMAWLMMQGKCRFCDNDLPGRYPIVQVCMSALFVAAALSINRPLPVMAFCTFLGALLTLSIVNFRHYIIPNRILYPSLLLSSGLLLIDSVARNSWLPARDAAIGGLSTFLVGFVIHIISPRGMGFGLVRLGGFIGMMLGWLGLWLIPIALAAWIIISTPIYLAAMLFFGRRRSDPEAPTNVLTPIIVALVIFGSRILGYVGG